MIHYYFVPWRMIALDAYAQYDFRPILAGASREGRYIRHALSGSHDLGGIASARHLEAPMIHIYVDFSRRGRYAPGARCGGCGRDFDTLRSHRDSAILSSLHAHGAERRTRTPIRKDARRVVCRCAARYSMPS